MRFSERSKFPSSRHNCIATMGQAERGKWSNGARVLIGLLLVCVASARKARTKRPADMGATGSVFAGNHQSEAVA